MDNLSSYDALTHVFKHLPDAIPTLARVCNLWRAAACASYGGDGSDLWDAAAKGHHRLIATIVQEYEACAAPVRKMLAMKVALCDVTSNLRELAICRVLSTTNPADADAASSLVGLIRPESPRTTGVEVVCSKCWHIIRNWGTPHSCDPLTAQAQVVLVKWYLQQPGVLDTKKRLRFVEALKTNEHQIRDEFAPLRYREELEADAALELGACMQNTANQLIHKAKYWNVVGEIIWGRLSDEQKNLALLKIADQR
jgi:hypothetical protein